MVVGDSKSYGVLLVSMMVEPDLDDAGANRSVRGREHGLCY